MENMSGTFPTPYYAVIFISQKHTDDPAFDKMQKVIASKVGSSRGFLGMDRCRTPEGLGFSISYWDSLDSVKAWRGDEDHTETQEQARQKWFLEYTIRTCSVEYDHCFTKDNPKEYRDADSRRFYIDDHALLFGVMAKSAEEIIGGSGLVVTEIAVELMAKERGNRAAQRCIRDGKELTEKNYFLYNELNDYEGWNKSQIVSLEPVYCTETINCGWNDIWRKYGLSEYGKLYCKWIDKSLAFGFNPQLKLEMKRFLTNGESSCVFLWTNCYFTNKNEFDELMAKRKSLMPFVTKGFLYQCGHLYSTLRRSYYLKFGVQIGEQILKSGMKKYIEIFGQEKADIIITESQKDYLKV